MAVNEDQALSDGALSTSPMRLLLVQERVDGGLIRALAREGHDVLTVGHQARPERLLGVFRPDVILVAVADGAGICRHLRTAAANVAIIVLLPGRAIDARVTALGAGADDCLSAPFSQAELNARVRAVARRVSPAARSVPELRSSAAAP